MDQWQNELRVARELALAAGQVVMEHRRAGVTVERKAGNEPVTAADRAASDLILAGLRTAFPDDVHISEEAPDDVRRRQPGARVWYVDPIDGTQDFIDGREGFAPQIGLCVDGQPVAGAVYQPATGRLYWGGPDVGAFCEAAGTSRPIHVSTVNEFPDVRLVVSASHPSKRVAQIKDLLGIHREFRVGSIGVKVALIAAGEQDLYCSATTRASAWDTCAPHAILLGAGGCFTNIYGEPLVYNGKGVAHLQGLMASNGVLHMEIARRIRHLLPPSLT
jgi:3'(2'), 5'-bisphosphate nucleotidase